MGRLLAILFCMAVMIAVMIIIKWTMGAKKRHANRDYEMYKRTAELEHENGILPHIDSNVLAACPLPSCTPGRSILYSEAPALEVVKPHSRNIFASGDYNKDYMERANSLFVQTPNELRRQNLLTAEQEKTIHEKAKLYRALVDLDKRTDLTPGERDIEERRLLALQHDL